MSKYSMVDFYVESRDGITEATALQITDVLTRAFDQMKDFGVTMTERKIDGLNGETLQRWVNRLKKDRKPATVNNYICILNPFLRWAHTMTYGKGIRYIDEDISGVIKTMKLPSPDSIPEEERPKDKYYTEDEINELLQIPRNDTVLKKRDRAIIALFLASGLRVSELCSLTIGSIYDREHGTVYVRRKGGAWKTTEVAEFAYAYIDTYIRTRPDAHDHSAPLFVTVQGLPCNRKQIYKSLSTKQRKLDIATGAHAMRHTFISEVEKLGGSAVARDLANHKSLVVTNRYDHSTAEQRRDTVNALKWGK